MIYRHVAQRTGLDPFARQIYMIERDGKQVIQTGIDGYRLVGHRAARRDRVKVSLSAPEWYDPEERAWTDVWLRPDRPPAAARMIVYRDGEPFPGVALWAEYSQWTNRGGQGPRLTRMWQQRGAGQLAKCAEALAWRKAFPQDLAGIYTAEEMGGGAPTVTSTVLHSGPPTSREILEEDPPDEGADDNIEDADVVDDETPGGGGPSEGNPSSSDGQPLPPPGPDLPANAMRPAMLKALWATLREKFPNEDAARDECSRLVGRNLGSLNELTRPEGAMILQHFKDGQ